MKRIFILFLCFVSVLGVCAQGMTDQQVMRYIARQKKAGATQSQIVTNLMQRGVNMEQIRRLRNQYESQATGGVRAAAGAVSAPVETLEQNQDGTVSQELNTAKVNTTGEVYANASEEADEVEHDIQATQG